MWVTVNDTRLRWVNLKIPPWEQSASVQICRSQCRAPSPQPGGRSGTGQESHRKQVTKDTLSSSFSTRQTVSGKAPNTTRCSRHGKRLVTEVSFSWGSATYPGHSFPSRERPTEQAELRSAAEGSGNLPRRSCLENPMDRGAWRAPVPGVAESQIPLSGCEHKGNCKLYLTPILRLHVTQSAASSSWGQGGPEASPQPSHLPFKPAALETDGSHSCISAHHFSLYSSNLKATKLSGN